MGQSISDNLGNVAMASLLWQATPFVHVMSSRSWNAGWSIAVCLSYA